MDLNKLLKPRTVAIVGASEKDGFGGDTTRNYLKFSRDLDHLYLVNPKRAEIFGRRAYPSLLDIPGDVDLVILCTPQKTIIPLLRDAAQKHCGGAVVFASGYGVIEAGDLEELCGLAGALSWLGAMPRGDRCVFMNV